MFAKVLVHLRLSIAAAVETSKSVISDMERDNLQLSPEIGAQDGPCPRDNCGPSNRYRSEQHGSGHSRYMDAYRQG
jgi:hypothetical protein